MRTRIIGAGLLATGVLASAGLLGAGAALQEQDERPTPRAPFDVVDSVSPSNQALKQYFDTLRFLSDHVSSDERPANGLGAQSLMRIEPEIGVHRLRESELRQGRVVARFVSLDSAVRRFALLPKGVTYWWIKYDGTRSSVVYISTDSTGRIAHRTPVQLLWDTTSRHPPVVRQPLARWTISGSTGRVAAACMPGCPTGWCKGDTLRHDRTWLMKR